MVSHCAVWNCTSKLGTSNIRFYRIPEIFTKNEKLEKLSLHRRKAWIKAIKRQDLTQQELKIAKVCSRHFQKGRTVSLTEQDDPDWIPNMNLGDRKTSRLIFKQERMEDGGSSADEQVITEMHYEDDNIDDSEDKNLITEDIVEEDEEEHEEIVLESTPAHASGPVVVRTMTPVRSTQQMMPTTTIKKITVTPVTSSSFAGRKEYKVTTAGNKVSPIMVTQKLVQTPGRTVTVMPKQDSTFKFAQIAGQTTIKRKLDTPTSSPVVVKLPVDLKRFKPVQARSLGNFVIQKDSGITTMPKIVRLVRNKVDRTTQTDISGEFLEQYQALIDENQLKIAQLEEQVRKCKYTPEMFENDDKRTEYFTGLDSYVTMITLYNTCEAELPQSTALTKFEIFILTLLKLRLKLPLTFLAYQFCITPKAANFYFNECLNVLHKSLRELFAEPGDGQDGNIEIIADENYKD
ncbi:hypothetical protein DMENIID0001_126200 [Sergentomyia squamirostris]